MRCRSQAARMFCNETGDVSNLVGLDGKPVSEPIPAVDTPEHILQALLEEIRAGKVTVKRLICVVEADADTPFFTRSSLMMNSEAIALTAVGHRLIVDDLLER